MKYTWDKNTNIGRKVHATTKCDKGRCGEEDGIMSLKLVWDKCNDVMMHFVLGMVSPEPIMGPGQ